MPTPAPLPRTVRPAACARIPSCITAAGLALAAVGLAHGQVTPALEEVSDEVITIEEFRVEATRAQDEWFSTQAMSGTRTAAPVIELPYQIQIVTQEFIEDFEMLSLGDQMSMFSGYSAQPNESDAAISATASAARLRGFPVTILRDGFKRTPPPQIGNTYQVEAIKGPMSTLYGMTQPGGVINYVSKRPTNRPQYKISAVGGSYDYLRGSLFASGPIVDKKLFYMVSAERYKRDSNYEFVESTNDTLFFGLLYKFTQKSSVYVTYEAQRLEGRRAASFPRLVTNANIQASNTGHWNRDDGFVGDYFWPLARIGHNRMGPNEWYERNYDGIGVLFEHNYNSNWKQRFSYRWHEKSFWQHLMTTYDVTWLPMQNRYGYVNIYPRNRIQDIDSPYSLQTDLVGRVRTGKLVHSLLLSADYAKETTQDAYWRLTAAQEADLSIVPRSVRYMDPFNPDWRPYDPNGMVRRVSKDNEEVVTKGVSISDRVAVANGNVMLMGNVRYDISEFKVDSNNSNVENIWHEGEDDAVTYSYGVNWRARGNNSLVLFANYSTSFNANPTYDSGTRELLPNERGAGAEFGIKSLSVDGRLGYTISFFDIEKTNIGTPNPDYLAGVDTGEPQYLGIGSERVKGVEGDINWKLTDGLTVLGNISYNDAIITESTNVYLRGQRKLLVPRTTSSLSLRYNFPGRLRGLSMGASVRYTGAYVNQHYANTGNNITYLYVESPSLANYGAFVKYRWKTGKRYTHSLRVTGSNLADKFYIGTNGKLGLGRQINLGYDLSFR